MPRILIRADASPAIGGGHVMRCLALADALAANGAQVTFACAEVTDFLIGRIESAGHGLRRIGRSANPKDWQAPLPNQLQQEDARRTLAAASEPDWIVVDHYGLGRAWEEAAGAPARAMLAVDDLANRPHTCRLLVDQTCGRAPDDYAALVPADATILVGARFAMLRPEFVAARPEALARRRQPRPVGQLLVSLGTTDPGGLTARVVEDVLAAGIGCPIDVVLGSSAPSLAAVAELAARNSPLRVHTDVADMARLMARADLAVGAAGVSSWERCCLGLPAVALVLAANQRLIADRLAAAGAQQVVEGCGEPLRSALTALAGDAEARLRMARAAADIVDGRGIERILAAMAERNTE